MRNKYAIKVIRDCAQDFEYAQGPDIFMRKTTFQKESYDAWALDTVLEIVGRDPDVMRTLTRQQELFENVKCRTYAARQIKAAYLKAIEFVMDFLVAMEE